MLQESPQEINKSRTFQGRDINKIIEDYMPLIIKTISNTTGRYVSMENSEELSIGLMAFVEATEKYEASKGEFSSFAKLVIKSRIINYLKKENKNEDILSIDYLKEQGIDILESYIEPANEEDLLKEEIEILKQEIELFGFGFEALIAESPRHKDTRDNAIALSEKVSHDEEFISFMYNKKRLPIIAISRKFKVTEKMIKRSKKFIISVVIIFYKKLSSIRLWISG